MAESVHAYTDERLDPTRDTNVGREVTKAGKPYELFGIFPYFLRTIMI